MRDGQSPALTIGIVYFSGSGVTRSYAEVMAEALQQRGCTVRLLDVTPAAARQARPALDESRIITEAGQTAA